MLDGTLEVWCRMEMSTPEDGTCNMTTWIWYVISFHHAKVACIVGQVIDPVFASSTTGPSSADQRLGLKYPLMSPDELAILSLYTIESIPKEKSFYFAMNEALRARDREQVKQWKEAIWLLLVAMKKLPRESSALLHRGVKRSATDLGKQCQKGKTFVWSGFSSTTTHVEGLKSFLGQTGPRTLWQLQLRQNFDGVNLKAFSLYPDEHEVLLPPQMEFKVNSAVDLGNDLTLVQCQQIEEIDPLIDFTQVPLGKP